jgi:SNF2 family DNA or RNA helicase
MKLRQIASRAKLEPFLDQLEGAIDGGHRILVFSQFVKMLKAIGDELEERGIPFCYLDGSTKDRLGECSKFNRSRDIPVFLISLMAGGTGLNLTGADMVIHYDPWWNPAVEDQATDRAHRIGQTRNVYVMKMIASGTIEERVLAMQRRKQAVIAATVSTTDSAVMERLTAEDIAALLS